MPDFKNLFFQKVAYSPGLHFLQSNSSKNIFFNLFSRNWAGINFFTIYHLLSALSWPALSALSWDALSPVATRSSYTRSA